MPRRSWRATIRRCPTLEHPVAQRAHLNAGDQVVTSGDGGLLPAGLADRNVIVRIGRRLSRRAVCRSDARRRMCRFWTSSSRPKQPPAPSPNDLAGDRRRASAGARRRRRSPTRCDAPPQVPPAPGPLPAQPQPANRCRAKPAPPAAAAHGGAGEPTIGTMSEAAPWSASSSIIGGRVPLRAHSGAAAASWPRLHRQCADSRSWAAWCRRRCWRSCRSISGAWCGPT